MTPVDHRRPSARAARSQRKSPSRQRTDQPQERRARKPQRSHSAVGAAIVAAAAMVAVFAFILTRGSSEPPTDEGLRVGAAAGGGAAAPAPKPMQSADPSPSINTAKADRKPPASSAAPKTKAQTTVTPNTGPAAPVFRRGQWIVVMEKYPTDVGMDAEQLAKATAVKMITAGVPAKAMLVNGQYPGIANSSMEPVVNTWIVYLGPGPSAAQLVELCSAPKTQAAYSNSACPTFEPAVATP